MHERPGARAPAPWQAARASAWAGSARALAHGQAARARALAHGQAARARALAHGQPARARALAHGQAARARVLARGQPARALAHGQAARARARTSALAGSARCARTRALAGMRARARTRALAGIARARTRALAGMRARAHPRPGRQRARAHPRPCARASGCGEIHSPVPNIILRECGILAAPRSRLWPTKPQSEDNSLALPTWLSRGVERLTPPGPWDFLEALWGVWFARPKTNGCVLAGHILKTKHWFSDAIFIMGTAYEIHRAVAKSTVLCLTSFFMNVESWPLLGQVDVGLWPTKPQSEDNSLALPTWLSRGVERLTPPGPWDFLEALWVKCGGCRGIACRSCPECNVLVPTGSPRCTTTRNLGRSCRVPNIILHECGILAAPRSSEMDVGVFLCWKCPENNALVPTRSPPSTLKCEILADPGQVGGCRVVADQATI
ncbi:hypothetical protein VNO78_35735 [Psophocarpus tetragonolobus]|uniref:Uncharacterized protein n=1 Tax=Psophocarpus tetragonolobus TaxID=3891 RepID=A0AAN9NM74_PSOTE